MMKPAFIPGFHQLRGIASVWVVLFHVKIYLFPEVHPLWLRPLLRGYLLVDLFFVLSGFLIGYLYGKHFKEAISLQTFFSYLKARFARIYPLHLFTLFLLVSWYALNVWGFGKPREYGRIYVEEAIATHLLMVQAWGFHSGNTWNIPSWSISTEWAAYLLFPFLWHVLYRCGKVGAIVGITVGILGYGCLEWLHPKENLDITFDWAVLRGLSGFGIGMALYAFTLLSPRHPFFTFPLSLVKVIFPSFTVITLIVMTYAPTDTLVVALWPCWAWLAYQSSVQTGMLRKALTFLGDISFALYMIHLPVLYLVPQILGMGDPERMGIGDRMGISVIFIGFVLWASYHTYHRIERPSRNWIRTKLGITPLSAVD
ncbi:MAG: acyltransferase [Bacteroidetes Order II. Incertae sedis bacterium]|nr:acyltransferase [Bacteroidetes Order II. bacterium]